MTKAGTSRWLLLALLCAASASGALRAQEAGKTVLIQGEIARDVYAAGGTVDVLATVDGDVVAAGGHVVVGERVSGDVAAAGGSVTVQARVADDVRVAGGEITLSGPVGDDAVAAGGRVRLAPTASVGGRAWFSGGRVEVAGSVGRELRAAGGQILISGRVDGDVELMGRSISILETAVITGDLRYRSPDEAAIAPGAQIQGKVSYEPMTRPALPVFAALAGIGIFLLLSLTVAGTALILIFRDFIGSAGSTIRTEPWKCLGLGLAVFAATPVVIALLLSTVIGGLLALVIGALYLILLLAGFLTGIFFVGRLGSGRRAGGEASRGRLVFSFVVALILVGLLALIPLFGLLLLFVLMLLGTGSLTLAMYRRYTGQTAPQ